MINKMIRHIFKIIWNERKTNVWILTEYVVVFCILWFCADFLCFMGKSYMEPLGFNIDNTYHIQMGYKEPVISDTDSKNVITDDFGQIQTFINRVTQYPGVESISFSYQGIPYFGATSTGEFKVDPDSLLERLRIRWVSSGFFDVFKIDMRGGRIFNWEDKAEMQNIIISPDRNNRFGKYPNATHIVSNVSSISNINEKFTVIGYAGKVKDSFYDPYTSNVFVPIDKENLKLHAVQISIRVHPDVNENFAERFAKDMRDQLTIGPHFLASVTSLDEIKKNKIHFAVLDNLNSIYAITVFLIINIFLGIIGTFWNRTQSRRSEIGLRMALGSTKKEIKSQMFRETILILFVASLIGVNICLNIGQSDILTTLGLPMADRVQSGVGIEQDLINFGLTFLFLALISFVAVWYPARQASSVPPAEALREE